MMQRVFESLQTASTVTFMGAVLFVFLSLILCTIIMAINTGLDTKRSFAAEKARKASVYMILLGMLTYLVYAGLLLGQMIVSAYAGYS